VSAASPYSSSLTGSALIDQRSAEPFWLSTRSSVFRHRRPGVAGAVRFFVAANVGLVRDEAYYTLWSFWPGPGYLDHPPMIAWMVAAGRALLGENELAVRLFPLLATGVTSWAIYRTGRLLFDAATAAIAVIWFNVTVAAGLLFIARRMRPR
jgi:hypothetical protein